MLRHSFINIVVSVHKENLFDSIRTKIGNAHYSIKYRLIREQVKKYLSQNMIFFTN